MMTVLSAHERFLTRIDWLESYHSFSFGEHFDPARMGFSDLRVINDDRVAPGGGFPTHGHRDMEILTYVVEGALEHKDSMGNGSIIVPGDVQKMSAGTGIRHSEFNPDKSTPCHLLQIWIQPSRPGISPEYQQKHFPLEGRRGRLQKVASPDGAEGSIIVHQSVTLYATVLEAGQRVAHVPARGRRSYLQVVRGRLEINGQMLSEGDGAALTGEVSLIGRESAEALLFDLR